jgi:hypothetical protein
MPPKIKMWSAKRNRPSVSGFSSNIFQENELQKQKFKEKIVQFYAESLKEQVLKYQQNSYEILKESAKYIVECQLTGKQS